MSLDSLPELNRALCLKGFDRQATLNREIVLQEQLQRVDELISASKRDVQPLDSLEKCDVSELETVRKRFAEELAGLYPPEHVKRVILLQLPSALLMTLFSFRTNGTTRNSFWNQSRSNARPNDGETNYPPLEAVLSWGHSRDLNVLVRDYYEAFCLEDEGSREAFWTALSGMPISSCLAIAADPDPIARKKARSDWANPKSQKIDYTKIHHRMTALCVAFDQRRNVRRSTRGENDSKHESTMSQDLKLLIGKVLGEPLESDPEVASSRFVSRNAEYLALLREYESLAKQAEELIQQDDVTDKVNPTFVVDNGEKKRKKGVRRPRKSNAEPIVDCDIDEKSELLTNPAWKQTTVEVLERYRRVWLQLLEFERKPPDSEDSAFLAHPTDFLFPTLNPCRVHFPLKLGFPHSNRLVKSNDVVGVIQGAAKFLTSEFEKVFRSNESDPKLCLAAFVGCALRLLILVRRKLRNWATELPFPHSTLEVLPLPPGAESEYDDVPPTTQRALVYFRSLPYCLFKSPHDPNSNLSVHAAWSQSFWWQNLDQNPTLYRSVEPNMKGHYLHQAARCFMLGHDLEVKSVLDPRSTSVQNPCCPFDQLYPQKIHAAYVVGKNAEASQNVLTEKLNLQTRFSPTRLAYSHIPGYAESMRALAGTALLFDTHSSLRLPRFSEAYFDRADNLSKPPSSLFYQVQPLPKLTTLVQKRKEQDLAGHVHQLAQDPTLQQCASSVVSFWSNQVPIGSDVRRNVINIQRLQFERILRDEVDRRNQTLSLTQIPFEPERRSSSSSVDSRERFLQRVDRLLPQS